MLPNCLTNDDVLKRLFPNRSLNNLYLKYFINTYIVLLPIRPVVQEDFN